MSVESRPSRDVIPIFPKFFIESKEEQLKQAMKQFLSMDTPFCTGLYIFLRWCFLKLNNYGNELFLVQLFNLSSGVAVSRVWELHGNNLVLDSKFDIRQFNQVPVFIYPKGWWQRLIEDGLSEKSNRSLQALLSKFRLGLKSGGVYAIDSGACMAELSSNKDAFRINYKIRLELRYDWGKQVLKVKGRVFSSTQKAYRNGSTFEQKEWITEIVDYRTIESPGDLNQELRENMVIFAREELHRIGFYEQNWDYIVESYLMQSMKRTSKGITANFDLLLRSQYSTILLISVIVIFDGIHYKISDAKKLILHLKNMDNFKKNAKVLTLWQRIFKKEDLVDTIHREKLIEIGMAGVRFSSKFQEVLSIEARAKHNKINGDIMGFEYRVYVKLRSRAQDLYYEWVIYGDPNKPGSLALESMNEIEEEDAFRAEHQCELHPTEEDQPSVVEDRLFSQVLQSKRTSNRNDTSRILADIKRESPSPKGNRNFGMRPIKSNTKKTKLSELMLQSWRGKKKFSPNSSVVMNANQSFEIGRYDRIEVGSNERLNQSFLPKINSSFAE